MQVRYVPVGLLMGLSLTLASSQLASATPDRGDLSQSRQAAGAGATWDDPLLDGPTRGKRAVEQLGPDLAAAAARNDLRASQLRSLLTTDRTAWLDAAGRLFFIDPAPGASAPAAEPAAAGATPYPLDQTFLLHSEPGSTKTIYLDFDGTNVTGTAWNRPAPDGPGLPPGDYPAWNTDGSAATFGDSERTAIQSIWQRVAEDYAPFDVDVTTADPGDAALNRSTANDPTFGTRALISPSNAARASVCQGSACGGVAYIGSFNDSGLPANYYQPAWVFPQALGNSSKNIAEAISHEVGHNLGLKHDGTAVQSYYAGQGSWAPIMGVGYSKPIAQFSKGEYAGANNTENDFGVIGSHGLAYRTDEAGDTVASGASINGTATGYVTTAGDVDVYTFYRSCQSPFTVTATPAATSPNLDIELTLTRPGGATTIDNPDSGGSGDVAVGMGASITTGSTAVGAYSVQVDGSGAQDPSSTGYSDYGSVGQYTVALSNACPAAPAPSAPTGLSVTKDDAAGSATLSWAPPQDDGGAPLTGYEVGLDNAAPIVVGPATSTYTFAGLSRGTPHTLLVRATNSGGPGPGASSSVTLSSRPGAPQGVTVTPHDAEASATLDWSAPTFDGGSLITGYTVRQDGDVVDTLAATQRSFTFTGLAYAQDYSFDVRAINAVGAGPISGRVARVAGTPGAPPKKPTAARIGKARWGSSGGKVTAKAAWKAPASDGGDPITKYVVTAYRMSASGAVLQKKRFTRPGAARAYSAVLPKRGTWRFSVHAVNAAGASRESTRSNLVRAR